VLTVLLAAVVTLPATAVESGGVGGKPANPRADNPRSKSIFLYDLKPGQTVDDAVEVYNNSGQPKTIGVYAIDSVTSSDGAFACKQEVEERTGVGSWVKISNPDVTLAPNTTGKVSFTLTVPAKVDVGEHNGCIAIQDRTAAPQAAGNGVALSFRSAIRLAVTVPGEFIEKLSIKDVLIETRHDKMVVSPVLANDGNVSLDATQHVSLRGLLGDTLLDTSGQFNFDAKRPFWGGLYRQKTSVEYVRLGQPSSSKKSIPLHQSWYIISPQPAALALEIIGVLLIVLAVAWFLRRRKQQKLFASKLNDYTVKKGQHLQDIAKLHEIDWKLVAKINKLKPPYHIEPGQIIKLPETARTVEKKPTPKKKQASKSTKTSKNKTTKTKKAEK
jgi:nucleoid-associated protein YgaU